MGVYIKDMEMPETCEDCQFHRYHSHYEYVCVATPLFYPMNLANSEGIRKEWCPLVSVPEPHGRLIDADMLIKFVEDRYEITWESDCYEGGIKDACSDILEKIDTMPTVIEAEDGE
jgi:hypothetical protein